MPHSLYLVLTLPEDKKIMLFTAKKFKRGMYFESSNVQLKKTTYAEMLNLATLHVSANKETHGCFAVTAPEH